MLKLMIPLLLLPLIASSWSFYLTSLSTLMISSMFILINSSFHQYPLSHLFILDPLSSSLMILSMWITPLMMIASQNIFISRTKINHFCRLVSILTLILIASFSTSNMFMFFVFFEASLIPTLMIILSWGYQPERLQAGMYLMLYTITASLPLLLGISMMHMNNNPTNLFIYMHSCSYSHFLWWLMMNTAFMVKLPLFFSHLWLPKAHVEAPVAGSMILAGVLLKLGGYGLLRMSSMMAPLGTPLKSLILTLSLWGGMITSIICVRQSDMKSLIAYSSVGHMSLVMAGIVTNSKWGQYGALIMMLAHGLVSSAMFALANITYEKSSSRSMILNKGNLTLSPAMSLMWFLMSAANMAAPPSINLLSEIMLITTTMLHASPLMLPLGTMSMMAAIYSLILYSSMNHGPLNSLMNFHSPAWWRELTIPTLHFIPVLLLISHPLIISSW